MPILLLPVMGLAACGLALAAAVHVGAVLGAEVPGGNALFVGLSAGAFAVILALIAVEKLQADRTNEPESVDFWAGFGGCPIWARHAIRALHYYVFATMVVLTALRFVKTGEFDMSLHYS